NRASTSRSVATTRRPRTSSIGRCAHAGAIRPTAAHWQTQRNSRRPSRTLLLLPRGGLPLRHLSAGAAGFAQTDCDRLFPARHFLAGTAGLELTLLQLPHGELDLPRRLRPILARGLLTRGLLARRLLAGTRLLPSGHQ